MFRVLWLAVATYVLFVAQTSLVRECSIAGIVPQFPCAALALLVVCCRGRTGLVCAAAWGLLADLLGDGRIGGNTLCFCLACAALESGLATLPRGIPLIREMAGAVIVAACSILCVAATSALNGDLWAMTSHWPMILWQAAYTSSIAFLLLLATLRWKNTSFDFSSPDAEPVSNRWTMLTE